MEIEIEMGMGTEIEPFVLKTEQRNMKSKHSNQITHLIIVVK